MQTIELSLLKQQRKATSGSLVDFNDIKRKVLKANMLMSEKQVRKASEDDTLSRANSGLSMSGIEESKEEARMPSLSPNPSSKASSVSASPAVQRETPVGKINVMDRHKSFGRGARDALETEESKLPEHHIESGHVIQASKRSNGALASDTEDIHHRTAPDSLVRADSLGV